MSGRSPIARALLAAGLAPVGALAVLGGLTLQGSGVAAVALAGGVAACLGAGVAAQDPARGVARRSAVAASWQSAAWTMGTLLVLAGLAAVGGGALVTIGGLAGLTVGLVVWLRRTRIAATAPVPGPDAGPPTLAPVTELSTDALSREWLRTGGALAAALEPTTRQHVVARRQDTLDELERRDPVGFSRWLSTGAGPDSDPTEHIQGDTAAGPA